jgi:hypothetical protein
LGGIRRGARPSKIPQKFDDIGAPIEMVSGAATAAGLATVGVPPVVGYAIGSFVGGILWKILLQILRIFF